MENVRKIQIRERSETNSPRLWGFQSLVFNVRGQSSDKRNTTFVNSAETRTSERMVGPYLS